MAYLIRRNRRRRIIRRPRVFKARVLLAQISDEECLNDYRFPRDEITNIIDGFRDSNFANKTARSMAMLPETQVLIALRFFAKSGHLSELAKLHGVSRSSVCRAIARVSSYLCSLAPTEIRMPNDRNELARIAKGFHRIAGFPRVIGAIDGTHINIQAPSEEEHAFVNRKGQHSVNAMVTCDSDLVILDMVVKWPGSAHDSFILNLSDIRDNFEAGQYGNYWLLGDSGYPCKKWLLTPLLNPNGEQEERYNRAQTRTRSTIERCFGVLKSRFRCLHMTGGVLALKPGTVCKVIVACGVLHNRARKLKLANVPQVPEDENSDSDDDIEDEADGVNMRRNVVNQVFH